MCTFSFNPFRKDVPDWTDPAFAFLNATDMLGFHRSLPGYAPTPLRRLSDMAKALGVRDILVKDESQRFGIKAFKALGARSFCQGCSNVLYPGLLTGSSSCRANEWADHLAAVPV